MADILTPTELARFKTKFVEGRPDQCWNWAGTHLGSSGAPQFDANRRPDGTRPRYSAARAMYELRRGTVPKGAYVLPKCLNKLCVNPAHLVLSSTPRFRPEALAETAAPVPVALVEPAPQSATRFDVTELWVSSLDVLDASHVPALDAELARLNRRIGTVQYLRALAGSRPTATPAVVRVSAPPKPAPVSAPKAASKPAPKRRAQKPASRPSSRNVLARRMVYFLAAAEQPVPVATIAAAMSSTKSAVEYQLKSPWFLRTGDTVGVTDAGRTVALEGRS